MTTSTDVALEGDDTATSEQHRHPWRWGAGFAAAGVVLFFCYLAQSRSVPVNSDGASQALEAWAMLHGNLLLHGWHLSDVSFYTTELPEYMLVESVRGLSPDVIHVAGALTYTLLVLLAGLLAKGTASGKEAVVRVLAAAAVMLAPELGTPTLILVLSPDHVGTGVPVLLTWLVIDRAKPRWYVPVVVCLMLAWALVADSLVLVIAIVPLVAVCLVRVAGAFLEGRGSLASLWYELSLGLAAVLSIGVAALVTSFIRARSGYVVSPVGIQLARLGQIPHHLWLTIQGILVLFAADFLLHPRPVSIAYAVTHLVVVAAVAWALWLAWQRFFRWRDFVVPGFALAITLDLVLYVISTRPFNLSSTREIAPVLPFAAVLVGRLVAPRLLRARFVRVGAGLLACFLGLLAYGAASSGASAANEPLARWLEAHHLSSGLAGYWQSNSTTIDAGARVRINYVKVRNGFLVPGHWETDLRQYNAHVHTANFAVFLAHNPQLPRLGNALRTFGRPEHIYHFQHYLILVWNMNLLSRLH